MSVPQTCFFRTPVTPLTTTVGRSSNDPSTIERPRVVRALPVDRHGSNCSSRAIRASIPRNIVSHPVNGRSSRIGTGQEGASRPTTSNNPILDRTPQWVNETTNQQTAPTTLRRPAFNLIVTSPATDAVSLSETASWDRIAHSQAAWHFHEHGQTTRSPQTRTRRKGISLLGGCFSAEKGGSARRSGAALSHTGSSDNGRHWRGLRPGTRS